MMIDVALKDGRTLFRLAHRGQMVDMLKCDPLTIDQADSIDGWALWQRADDPADWRPVKLMFLNASSIQYVREVDASDAELFGEFVHAHVAEAYA